MPGLRKIAKAYGGLVAKNKDKVVVHKWDDEKDEPYIEAEMAREEYDRLERSPKAQ